MVQMAHQKEEENENEQEEEDGEGREDSGDNESFLIFVSAGSTSHLLCHDDRYEGRLLAFIIYLSSEEWEDCDGGLLFTFSLFLSLIYIFPLGQISLPTHRPSRSFLNRFRDDSTSLCDEVSSPEME